MKSCLRQADGEMQKNWVHFPSDTKNLTNETKKQRKRQFLVPRYYYVVEVLKEYPELSRGAY